MFTLPVKQGVVDPEEKQRRLQNLKNAVPYVSQSALGAIIAHIAEHGLPSNDGVGCSRHGVRRARDAALADEDTPFGPLIKRIELPSVHAPLANIVVDIACPFGMLYVASKTRYFGGHLMATYRRDPPVARPWSLVLYSDEVTPGNPYKQLNHRMTQSIYWSFMNFGSSLLAKEDMWFTCATLKSTDVQRVNGGMSAVYAGLLKLMLPAEGPSFHRSGILLHPDFGGGTLRVFASFDCNLSDESALHQVWLCKGASGIKCCVECMSVVNTNWIGLPFANPWFKPYSHPSTFHESGLVRHTVHTIHAIVDELAAAKAVMGPTAFKEKEKSIGFTHNPNSILLDPALRDIVDPSRQNCFDWAHNILAGIVPNLVGLIASELHTLKFNFYEHMNEYVRLFTWPSRISNKKAEGLNCFCPKRARSSWAAGVWKCAQSEALSLHAVMAHFMRKVLIPNDMATAAANCFLVLSSLIHMFVACAKGLVQLSYASTYKLV